MHHFISLVHFLSTLDSRYLLVPPKISMLYQQLSNCGLCSTSILKSQGNYSVVPFVLVYLILVI